MRRVARTRMECVSNLTKTKYKRPTVSQRSSNTTLTRLRSRQSEIKADTRVKCKVTLATTDWRLFIHQLLRLRVKRRSSQQWGLWCASNAASCATSPSGARAMAAGPAQRALTGAWTCAAFDIQGEHKRWMDLFCLRFWRSMLVNLRKFFSQI